MKQAAIRIRTQEPDLSNFPSQKFDWSTSVYEELKGIVPKDIQKSYGKFMMFSQYFDANVMHYLATGRSVTGIILFIDNTTSNWYLKIQPTVGTAPYGEEFVAARICVE